ncbi:MAG TPA: ribonuclease P protein component [Opitutaceae bacterium]|nr:ribonuclease P protein component [Opitutaceae bacterium]
MRFRTEQHLRRQSDIRGVRENGRRLECRAFTVWWRRREKIVSAADSAVAVPANAPPAINHSRVCVIASTSGVGAATKRNRAKRRLREIFRHHQHLVPADCDLLLIARGAVLSWPYAELEKKFTEACGHLSPRIKND